MSRDLLAVLPLAALLVSCNFQREKIPAQAFDFQTAPLTFASVRTHVLTPYCLCCHNTAQPAGDLAFEDYSTMIENGAIVPFDADGSPAFVQAREESMPPQGPAVPKDRITFLERWIAAGAPRTEDDIVPPPQEEKPRLVYADIAAALFQPYCVRCHSGDKPAKGLPLTTYAEFFNPARPMIIPRKVASSPLVQIIDAGKMPPRGVKIPDEQLEKLRTWIADGAPEFLTEEETP